MRLDNAHFLTTKNKTKMKTFKIEFQDNDQNELFTKVDEFVNLESAEVYAQLYIATSNINELSTYQITEL